MTLTRASPNSCARAMLYSTRKRKRTGRHTAAVSGSAQSNWKEVVAAHAGQRGDREGTRDRHSRRPCRRLMTSRNTAREIMNITEKLTALHDQMQMMAQNDMGAAQAIEDLRAALYGDQWEGF
jgi:hypothetical protein